jgi:hypothetical protein
VQDNGNFVVHDGECCNNSTKIIWATNTTQYTCTGSSVNLISSDCNAWQSLFIKDTLQAASANCTRSDPCSCASDYAKCQATRGSDSPSPCVICENNRIVHIDINGQSPHETGQTVTDSLSATIPTELGQLSGLVSLGISSNNLIGTIPSELDRIAGLVELGLVNNNLTGAIPASLGQLPKLTTLQLRGNQLVGSVPALPFGNYAHCYLDAPGLCVEPSCNHFSCPLPTGADKCRSFGTSSGVHCK